ncbi:MAG: RNase adapter RapZ [Bacteroidota bacterium]
MSTNHIQNIKSLLKKNGYPDDYQVIPMPSSGSNRVYYRVKFTDINVPSSLIASYNDDVSENIAHNSFTLHFRSLGLNVPEIYAHDKGFKYFLIQDLGESTLFDMLKVDRNRALKYYENVIDDLVDFQVEGIKNLDLDVAYPTKAFDKRSIMWDLNYFKYYFVKPHNIIFNEDLLQNDFEEFVDLLLNTDLNYFNYRDFQARNIMIYNDEPWYIDFQGGRRGSLQYDLVSLLYQAKANLSDDTRQHLYSQYIKTLDTKLKGSKLAFEKLYPSFIYFRLMQVMGAYGFRGLVQRKAHFLQSIPMVINSLYDILLKLDIGAPLNELKKIFGQIIILDYKSSSENSTGLTVNINSFSFKKKGIPTDITGNGGGHIFDCRSLPNPGRLAHLRDFTGLQEPVKKYLEEQIEVANFLTNAISIIDQSIENYKERKFNNLQINFGCTGGRHRSVFSASKVAEYVKNKFPDVNVEIHHLEL